MTVHRDEGMTLIEMLTTLAIAGIVMATATWAIRDYIKANAESGTAEQVQSALRNAQEQSLSEGRTYCVAFTATTWTVYKSDCTVAADKTSGPNHVADSSITLTSIAFPAVTGEYSACPTPGQCAYFYPRGTALAGSLGVSRPGKTYVVNVEGLTGRVSVG